MALTRSTGASRSSKQCSWIIEAICASTPQKGLFSSDEHRAMRFANGTINGFFVERTNRTEVDDFGVDIVLGGEQLGGLERGEDGAAMGDERNVSAFFLHVGHAEAESSTPPPAPRLFRHRGGVFSMNNTGSLSRMAVLSKPLAS